MDQFAFLAGGINSGEKIRAEAVAKFEAVCHQAERNAKANLNRQLQRIGERSKVNHAR